MSRLKVSVETSTVHVETIAAVIFQLGAGSLAGHTFCWLCYSLPGQLGLHSFHCKKQFLKILFFETYFPLNDQFRIHTKIIICLTSLIHTISHLHYTLTRWSDLRPLVTAGDPMGFIIIKGALMAAQRERNETRVSEHTKGTPEEEEG